MNKLKFIVLFTFLTLKAFSIDFYFSYSERLNEKYVLHFLRLNEDMNGLEEFYSREFSDIVESNYSNNLNRYLVNSESKLYNVTIDYPQVIFTEINRMSIIDNTPDTTLYINDLDITFAEKSLDGEKVFVPVIMVENHPRGMNFFGYKKIRMYDSNGKELYEKPLCDTSDIKKCYLTKPYMFGEDKFIYTDTINKEICIFNVINNTVERISGWLNGIAFNGLYFIYTTLDNVPRAVNTISNDVIELPHYKLNQVYVYNDIMISFFLIRTGLLSIYGTDFIIYNIRDNKEIYYQKNASFFLEHRYEFIGFY